MFEFESLHLRSTNDIDGKSDNDDKDAGPERPKPKAKRRRKKDRRLVLRDCCNYGKGSIRLDDIVCRAECSAKCVFFSCRIVLKNKNVNMSHELTMNLIWFWYEMVFSYSQTLWLRLLYLFSLRQWHVNDVKVNVHLVKQSNCQTMCLWPLWYLTLDSTLLILDSGPAVNCSASARGFKLSTVNYRF